jgi:malonyl-CoA O-methyltransferase
MSYHARRFDRAAASYADHSGFQARMAERLLALLPSDAVRGPRVEFGCGTGLFTKRLLARFPEPDLLATDAAPRMLAESERALGPHPGLAFAVCDASGALPVPGAIAAKGPFFLASSNATVQWFPDLARHLRWVAGLLPAEGFYLASGFARDNFPELNSILKEPPFDYADFPGHSAGNVTAAAESAGMTLKAFVSERSEAIFPSPRAFLETIRALGAARRPREDRPMNRARLDLLLRRYQERYPREGGVAATWAPWYALFRKA